MQERTINVVLQQAVVIPSLFLLSTSTSHHTHTHLLPMAVTLRILAITDHQIHTEDIHLLDPIVMTEDIRQIMEEVHHK